MKKDKKEVIYEGQFLRFIKQGRWEFVERNNCRGVVIILAMTDDGKVILTEQFRIPVGKNVIEFPAGLINDEEAYQNESMASTAKRELLEETGYRALKIKKIISGPVSGGSSADMVTIMQAFGLEKVGRGGGIDDECIQIHEVALSQIGRWLRQMERKGKLIDPKIYTGLYFLQKYNNGS